MSPPATKDSPFRDHGILVGAVIALIGAVAMLRNALGGGSPVLPLFMVLVGVSVPVLFWTRAQRAQGWRRKYRLIQVILGGVVLATGAALIAFGG